MQIGFTGTQRGMTELQEHSVHVLILQQRPTSVHHGDCIGSDAVFHEIIEWYTRPRRSGHECAIVIHPPRSDAKRAFKKGTGITHPPKPYIQRNHDIVDDSDVLIATPGEDNEVLRSGTWATIRYARMKKKLVYVVLPDGMVDAYNV